MATVRDRSFLRPSKDPTQYISQLIVTFVIVIVTSVIVENIPDIDRRCLHEFSDARASETHYHHLFVRLLLVTTKFLHG